MLYLGEKFSNKALLPADLKQRAQVNRWLLFAVTEVAQPLWRISRHTSLYPEEQRLPADVKITGREFKDMAAVLEQHMQRRQFLVGDRVTVADFVTAYTLDWGNEDKLLVRLHASSCIHEAHVCPPPSCRALLKRSRRFCRKLISPDDPAAAHLERLAARLPRRRS